VLVEGRPGVGKTTVARRLVGLLADARVPVAGFITQEIREEGRRVGFGIEALGGGEGILAHVEIPGPPRVGRYGVDLETFEGLAIPALSAPAGGVMVIDELGKMELASQRFREAVVGLFDERVPLVATVHAHRHAFTDALKRKPGVKTVRVTKENRDQLPEQLAARLDPD
jgi:nucleoside-triphosphatase